MKEANGHHTNDFYLADDMEFQREDPTRFDVPTVALPMTLGEANKLIRRLKRERLFLIGLSMVVAMVLAWVVVRVG